MISPFDIPLGTGMWVPLTVKPWGEPKALTSGLSILGKGFQIKKSGLEVKMSWELPPASRGEEGGDRGWVGTGQGDSSARLPGDPQSPQEGSHLLQLP